MFLHKFQVNSLSAVSLRNTHMTNNSFYYFAFPPLPPITRRQNSCLLGFVQTWTRAYPNLEMTPSFVGNGKQWVRSVIYCRAFDSFRLPRLSASTPWLIFTLPLFSGRSYNNLRNNSYSYPYYDAFFICKSYFTGARLTLTSSPGCYGTWVQLHARVWR